ncbi:right-handed parallel beta-helix repeat-containing protein, partial [Pseudomonas sp. JM10B5a]|nr:right-handed parallel beta-helix repeat-containing protein [Pseudomonas oligotrophica]
MLATRTNGNFRPAALIALLVFAGAAQAAPQPLSTLPLEPQGDNRWLLPAGQYQGQFRVEQPMVLRCAEGAVLDGAGQGNALTISAADVTIEGCTIRNWGRDMTAMNSAIFVERSARGTTLRDNQLTGAGFGIWLDGVADVSVIGNRIQGDPSVRSQDRGNGIHLYAVKGARVIGNQVRETRDGIYIDTSNGNHLENNLLEDLRYGVHYMFANDNSVIGNVTRRTRTGFALMQSRKLTVIGNRSEHDQNYGMLMNYITYSTIRDNFVSDVQSGDTDGDSMISGGEGKALFIYNSLFNSIENNHFGNS